MYGIIEKFRFLELISRMTKKLKSSRIKTKKLNVANIENFEDLPSEW